MKTITIILIALLAIVTIFFGVVAVKKVALDRTSKTTGVEETTGTELSTTDTSQTTAETTTPETSEITYESTDESIRNIEIYLDGDRENGIYLGEAEYGLESSEAALIYGPDFSNFGFKLKFTSPEHTFEPGSIHNLYIYINIPAYGWEYIKKEVMVPGEPEVSESIRMSIDSIVDNEPVSADKLKDLRISGWAADLSVAENPGINRVEVYIEGPRNFGKFLGEAQYGLERVDVGDAHGNANYNNSGYSLSFDASALEPGSSHRIYVYAYSPKGTHQYLTRNILIEGEPKDTNTLISADALFDSSGLEITGWAVNKKFIEYGVPRSLDIEYSVKKIVFTSNKSGNEDIWIMNLDGSELTQLTTSPGSDQYPAVSPDGKKIAYAADWQIVVMNSDGSGKKQITFGPYRYGFPSWSFDGNYIFLEIYIDDNWEIYRMDADGKNLKRLTINPGVNDWHPGAHTFEYKTLYESGPSGHEDIWIIDINGQNQVKITKSDRRYRVPKLSIDGSKIAFQGFDGNGKNQVFIMDANGENIVQLTDSPEGAGLPSFSPDNKYIVYNSRSGNNDEVYIMNIDGSGKTQLTNFPGDDWGAVFLYQAAE
ncbi:MAG: hypothetical protein FJW61_00020 [Actinobacteria bacterium]|nr:hypothetical protein [Actinomycetota bacterium]